MAASSTVCHVRSENPCITYAHRDALCLLVLHVFWRVVGYKIVHTKSAAGLFYACALTQSDCAGSLRLTRYRMDVRQSASGATKTGRPCQATGSNRDDGHGCSTGHGHKG